MKWYTRDASWWVSPSISSTRQPKLHLMADHDIVARCGLPIALIDDQAIEDPPECRKCKRCKKLLESME